MTQKQLADAMNISDKTISKWERGLGCPDVSLLGELSAILGVNIEKILSGDLEPNKADGGNMNKMKFYVCPDCGNILHGTGEAEISCCGRRLMPLTAKMADDAHELKTEEVEEDYYISFTHEMSKAHFLSFAAYVTTDKMLFIKLYPEQGAAIRFPKLYGGKLYYYCSRHGLFMSKI
jgi:DNA-binding XRE family transcriptional regulator